MEPLLHMIVVIFLLILFTWIVSKNTRQVGFIEDEVQTSTTTFEGKTYPPSTVKTVKKIV